MSRVAQVAPDLNHGIGRSALVQVLAFLLLVTIVAVSSGALAGRSGATVAFPRAEGLAPAADSVIPFGGASLGVNVLSSPLHAPVVGMAATPDGKGYWLVASDGGIFAFGDAAFHGSTGAIHLNQPIVGMASTPDGGGYWLVASDGGIFAFGDAPFYGSTGAIHLNKPMVGMAGI